MGPGVKSRPPRQDAHADPNVERDATISRLREELCRCNMKLAQVQARLTWAMDELDAQRHSHQRELHREVRAKEKLSAKLDSYLDDVRRMERERDDMRELVSILLGKVECCHDYSLWPCSRMGLANPVEPLIQFAPEASGTASQLHALRDTLVALLQRQLAEEKRAHALTREEAEAEISRLKAMVARRDAELQACATHDVHRVLLSSAASSASTSCGMCTHPDCASRKRSRDAGSVLPCPHRTTTVCSPVNDVDQLLAATMSRNRVLEREVESLKQGVLQAIQTRDQADRKTGNRPGRLSADSERHYASVEVQTVEPAYADLRNGTLPPSPGLLPYTMPSSPSPYHLTPWQGCVDPPGHLQGMRPASRWSRLASPNSGMQSLEQDVDRLSREIDDFIGERVALKRMLLDERQTGIPVHVEDETHNPHADIIALLTTVLTAPSVNPILVREQQGLREQLATFARERARREEELEAEIAALRQLLLDFQRDGRPTTSQQNGVRVKPPHAQATGDAWVRSTSLSPRVSPTLIPNDDCAIEIEERVQDKPQDPQDVPRGHERFKLAAVSDELGERPMDLATPLQTTIVSLREDDWLLPATPPTVDPRPPETHVDPANVPLPLSPDAAPSVAVSPPFLLSPLGFLSPSSPASNIPPSAIPSDSLVRMEAATEERIASIEQQIAATQRELEEKEAALAGLHSQLQAHSSSADVDADSQGQRLSC
ncbi:hypothetical protein BD414DRAFT_524884 [Trametes punicea]|nr:hypothetical protein BD414DRAFT_524884 [Trametes punicea]